MLQKDEVYLNLVLEYIPETVYKVARHYSKDEQTIPISFIKVSYTLQPLFKMINYFIYLRFVYYLTNICVKVLNWNYSLD